MNNGSAPSELRAQLALAIPLAAQQLGFQMMGLVDAAWLGRYSDTALAAAGIGNNLLFAITSIGLGIVMGLDTVIPQALGAGRTEDARRFLHAGLRIAVLIGLASTLVVMATPLLLDVADVPADVAEEARVYVYLRAAGVVPFLLSVALRSYLAARNVTRPLIIAVVVGNLANAVLDYFLIFGVDAIGLPPLGVIGAALATITVQVVIVFVYVASARAVNRDEPRPTSTRADLAEVLRYGLPVGGQLFAEVGIFGVATMLAANLGTVPASAHTIALTVSSCTFSAAVGVGSATAVRVGHAIGAGDVALARHRGAWKTMGPFRLGRLGILVAWIAVLWSIGVLVVCSLPPNQLPAAMLAGALLLLAGLYLTVVRKHFEGPRVKLAALESLLASNQPAA